MQHSYAHSSTVGESLYTRTVALTVDVYEFFKTHEQHIAALLENPKGQGRHLVASRAGNGEWLVESSQANAFLMAWKASISPIDNDSPSIRCLFYAAYEACTLFEQLPQPKSRPVEGLLWFHLPQWSLCFDSEQQQIHLASRISESQLDMLEEMLSAVKPSKVAALIVTQGIQEESRSYCKAVDRVIAYIKAGDVFQANIARFWSIPMQQSALLLLYDHLRQVNPAPFSCFVRAGGLSIVSASPERLFRLSTDGILETRPIAGTRKRSGGEDDDALLRNEMLLSEKERAEHMMLVDLERNDLGRVCVPGSVEVNELMTVEAYSTVQHIVSNVRGKVDAQYDVIDMFCAMFPGGTITGCPKIRCMEIIHELEQQARGPYTGAIGYIAWDGSADVNILIRTFWHHQGKLNWAAGAGIVADSIPEKEYIETEHKAEGLLRALR